jgi:hypothetical protein
LSFALFDDLFVVSDSAFKPFALDQGTCKENNDSVAAVSDMYELKQAMAADDRDF